MDLARQSGLLLGTFDAADQVSFFVELEQFLFDIVCEAKLFFITPNVLLTSMMSLSIVSTACTSFGSSLGLNLRICMAYSFLKRTFLIFFVGGVSPCLILRNSPQSALPPPYFISSAFLEISPLLYRPARNSGSSVNGLKAVANAIT